MDWYSTSTSTKRARWSKEEKETWTQVRAGPAVKKWQEQGQNLIKFNLWIHESEEKEESNNLPRENEMKFEVEMAKKWAWRCKNNAKFFSNYGASLTLSLSI